MNSRELENIINNQNPKYASNKRELMDRLSKMGARGEGSAYSYLGPFYETFMYAFFIGYNRNERIPPPNEKEKFLVIGEWKPETMRKEVLSHVFTRHSDIFDWNKMELDSNDDQIREKVREMTKIIEEYANAGLIYLEKKYNEDSSEFNDPFVFINILTSITDKAIINKK
jgi:hypothetical protein